MRKEFFFLLIVAVFLIFAFTPAALAVSCGEEAVIAEMGTAEIQVTVLKEPSNTEGITMPAPAAICSVASPLVNDSFI